VTICGVWLLLMVGASYLSYFHKTPVRIENWKPERVVPSPARRNGRTGRRVAPGPGRAAVCFR
jgi:hypothetical protein